MVIMKILKTAFPYAVAIALLTYVVWSNWRPAGSGGLEAVWNKHIIEGQPIPHPGYWLLAALVWVVSLLITFVRWYFLVRAVDLPFTIPDALRLGLVGNFFNSFMPGSIGGDILKAAFIAREQEGRRATAVATVMMDRLGGLWALVWFVAVLGAAFWAGGMLEGAVADRLKSLVTTSLVICGVSVVVWFLLGLLPPEQAERFGGRLSRVPKVGDTLAELWLTFSLYHNRQRSVLLAMILSFFGFIGFTLTYYFSAVTFQEPGQALPTWQEHFLVVPIGMVCQALFFLSPGGAGAGELVFGWLYKLLNYDKDLGVLMSLTQRMITWIVGLVGYLAYLRMRSGLANSLSERGDPTNV
jgi:hypothetical protein